MIRFSLMVTRLLIGCVLAVNMQCTVVFLLWPERYTPGFELPGEPGVAAVRGFGVLFLMWNVPYAAALWDPQRNRLALYEAIAMQSIGLAGESFISLSLPAIHSIAQASITRFILFDAVGLVMLVIAAWLSKAKILL